MHAAHDLTTPSRFFEFEMLASGRVLVRDQAVSAADARATGGILEDAFARHAHLAVACAKRVTGAQIAAHGVFVLHPKGFVRHGRGAPKDAERFDVEVDAVDHGVAVIDGAVFAAVRGEALLDPFVGFGTLALLAISLESRRRGLGRVLACAAAVIEEAPDTAERFEREGFGSAVAAAHLRAHLGFNAECCDLDEISNNATRSALRWNAPIWGAAVGFEKYVDRGAYHWELYRTHDAYRRRADTLISFLRANLPSIHAVTSGQTPQASGELPILDIGAGDALFAGLLARHGLHVLAVDAEAEAIAIADAAIARESLSDTVTCLQGTAENLPVPSDSCRAALLLDVIEHLRNPCRALAEIRRVLAPDGVLLVATPSWRYGHRNDPIYHLDEYREDELSRQLRACGFHVTHSARIKGVYDDLVVLARRTPVTDARQA